MGQVSSRTLDHGGKVHGIIPSAVRLPLSLCPDFLQALLFLSDPALDEPSLTPLLPSSSSFTLPHPARSSSPTRHPTEARFGRTRRRRSSTACTSARSSVRRLARPSSALSASARSSMCLAPMSTPK